MGRIRQIHSAATVAFQESSKILWKQIVGAFTGDYSIWIPGLTRVSPAGSLENGRILVACQTNGAEARVVILGINPDGHLDVRVEFSSALTRIYHIYVSDSAVHSQSTVHLTLSVEVEEGWRSVTEPEKQHFLGTIRCLQNLHHTGQVISQGFD